MELVLEMLSAKQFVPTELCSKTFGRNGGLIERGGECDWAIPDRKRHLSKQHARVSYRNGAFYLTDTSSNGIRAGNGSRLPHGEPQRIEQDSVFLLGDFEIRARLLREPDEFAMDVGRRSRRAASFRTMPSWPSIRCRRSTRTVQMPTN